MANVKYFVVLEDGALRYTLKEYTTIQNARKFIKKEADNIRWGMSFKDGLPLRIYKMDTNTNTPLAIYFN